MFNFYNKSVIKINPDSILKLRKILDSQLLIYQRIH